MIPTENYPDILYIQIHSTTEWGKLSNTVKDNITERHTKVLLSFGWEANMIVNWKSQNCIFIFDALHRFIDATGLPYDMFYFCQGNAFLEKCYKKWLIDTNQQKQIAGVFHHYSHFFKMFKNVRLSDKPAVDVYDRERCNTKPKYFSCLNGRPSTSRVNTLIHLYDNNLLDKSISTFVFNPSTIAELNQVRPDIAKILPMTIEETGKFSSFDLVPDTYWNKTESLFFDIYVNSYYDLVAETVLHLDMDICLIDDLKLLPIKKGENYIWQHNVFFTEKLIRNLFNKRPFLLMGGQHSLKVLHSLGFRTFDKILFDESYDNIADPMDRLDAVLLENLRIVEKYTLQDLHNIVYSSEMESILEHNFNRALELGELTEYDLLEKYLTADSN